MATLHGNWLHDLQQFFLWGETWRRVDPTAVADLQVKDAEERDALSLHEQPYQLTQQELIGSFEKTEELDLSWMQAALGKKVSASRKADTAEKKKVAGRKTRKSKQWQARVVVLPTRFQASDSTFNISPVLSSELSNQRDDSNQSTEDHDSLALYPWQLSGGVLDATTTIKFLSALPLGQSEASAFVGDDLRYWSHLTRWCLYLLARGKFVPVVSGD